MSLYIDTPTYYGISYGSGFLTDFACTLPESNVPRADNVVHLGRPIRSNLRVTPVYASDDVTIKYYMHELRVDTIIYENYSGRPIPQTFAAGVEEEVSRIRAILNTKGLKLRAYPAGLGMIPVINGTPSDLLYPQDKYQDDCRGGPFPQEVIVNPIAGNKAISVSWTVSFYLTTPCNPLNINANPTPSPTMPNVLSYQIRWNTETDTNTGLKIHAHGEIEFDLPLTEDRRRQAQSLLRLLILQGSYSTDSSYGTVFQGLKPTFRIETKPNQRVINFHAIFEEVQSPNPYFRYVTDMDVSHTVSSQLFGGQGYTDTTGFNRWHSTIKGSVTHIPLARRDLVWYMICRLISERTRRYTARKVKRPKTGATDPNDPEQQELVTVYDYNKFILLSAEITEHLYKYSIEFEFKWLIVSDLHSILSNSRMFTKVNTYYQNPNDIFNDANDFATLPKPTSDQWRLWQLNTYDDQSYEEPDTLYFLPNPVGFTYGTPKQTPGVVVRCEPGGLTEVPYWSNDTSAPFSPEGYDGYYEREVDRNYSEPPPFTESGDEADPITGLPLPAKLRLDNTSTAQEAFFANQNPLWLDSTQKVAAASSWVDYQMEYAIHEETNSVPITRLGKRFTKDNVTTTVYNARGDGAFQHPFDESRIGFSINNQNSEALAGEFPNDPSKNYRDVIVRGPSRYYLTLKGSAVRVGFKIPMPTVIGIGNIDFSSAGPGTPRVDLNDSNNFVQAYRVGTPRYTHKQIAVSGKTPVYLATWEVTYTFATDPSSSDILANIITTGEPSQFG